MRFHRAMSIEKVTPVANTRRKKNVTKGRTFMLSFMLGSLVQAENCPFSRSFPSFHLNDFGLPFPKM
ncbi:CLUMA_CG004447, isoform A [Clunio marinus]|uniref:CLUMA_CG004447, isoform A n=1 Tax=Clunio marinus TaxID=568069 RepID=A0A1J1HS00_9DIPT|nr:CLUMA_CG004447, isoform A [Clunio marinus]